MVRELCTSHQVVLVSEIIFRIASYMATVSYIMTMTVTPYEHITSILTVAFMVFISTTQKQAKLSPVSISRMVSCLLPRLMWIMLLTTGSSQVTVSIVMTTVETDYYC